MKSQLIDSPTPLIAACAFDEPISNTPPSELLNSPPGLLTNSPPPIVGSTTPTSMALQPIVPVPSFLVNPIVNSLPSSYPPLNTYNQQPHNPYQSFMYPQLSNVMQANPTPNLIAPTQSGFNYPTYPQPQQMLSQPYLSPFPFPHVESLPSIQPRPTIQPRPSVQLPIQPQPIRHSLQYPFNPEPSQNYFSGNTVNNTPAHVTPSPSPIISSASTNKNAHHTLTPVKKEPTTPSNSMEIVSFTPTKESDERALTTHQHHNNNHGNVEVPQYQDITHILCWNQIEAAKALNIPTSTLSKRWKEAVRNRKWPYRSVCKVDKEMLSLLQSIPKDAKQLPPEIQAELSRLIKVRNDLLKPVIIRTNGV